MKPVKLKNKIQHYTWGTADYIPSLLGIDNTEKEPFAELWMGTHPRGESVSMDDGTPVSEIIQSSPAEVLGKETVEKFGESLPFLFKVLSAGSPLSLQAHPNKKQAEEGFERENSASVPLDAYNRNYRDSNHKPEIICALTPFTAMCGFRAPEEIDTLFPRTGSGVYRAHLSKILKSGGLKDFFSTYMRLDKPLLQELIREVLAWAKEDDSLEAELVREFTSIYPSDPGVLSPLFLNVFSLKKGEALFQGPGELHAYVRGTGIELMANSDNVLRGGMTPKNVDLDELLNILNFNAEKPAVISGKETASCLYSYETKAEEFILERVVLDNGCKQVRKILDSAEILLCVDGGGTLAYSGGSIRFSVGESFFIPCSLGDYLIEGKGECFISSVPVKSNGVSGR